MGKTGRGSVSLEVNRENKSDRILLRIRLVPFVQQSGPTTIALGSASAKVIQVTLREAEAKLVSAQWDDGADENIIPADFFHRLFPRLALSSPGPQIGHISGLGEASRGPLVPRIRRPCSM